MNQRKQVSLTINFVEEKRRKVMANKCPVKELLEFFVDTLFSARERERERERVSEREKGKRGYVRTQVHLDYGTITCDFLWETAYG